MRIEKKIPGSITPPNVSKAVRRKRLIRVLDEARFKRLTWISGPAGCGKTTLLASYIRDRRIPCVWYQAGPRDADVATFFQYANLAIQNVIGSTAKSLPIFAMEHMSGIGAFARLYFESLFLALHTHGRDSALVIDDYQEVPEDSSFHRVILEGLESVPERCRVFVISRQDMPPSLAKWKADARSSFVSWNQLRFSVEEMNDFLASRFPRTRWAPSALQYLHDKTDGWISGLILLMHNTDIELRSFAGKSIAELFPAGFSLDQKKTDAVFDYFMSVIFEKLSPAMQMFLMKTSLLPFINVRMAEKVHPNGKAAGLLHSLIKNNYFTTEHHSGTNLYRYHPLFREFLRTHAEKRIKPKEFREIVKIAVPLLLEEDRVEDAASLYIRIEDWENLAALILDQAQNLYDRGNHATLDGWLSLLPEEMTVSNGWLLYWKAMCRIPTQFGDSQASLRKSFKLFQKNREMKGAIIACCTLIEMEMLILERDFRALDPFLEWIENAKPEKLARTKPEIIRRIAGTMLMALTLRNPRHPGIDFWREQAEKLIQGEASPAEKLSSFSRILAHYVSFGNHTRIKVLLKALESYKNPQNISSPQIILGSLVQAMAILYTGGDAEKVLQLLRDALALCRVSGVRPYQHWILYIAASAALACQDIKQAEYFLSQMKDEFMTDYKIAGFHILSGRKEVLLGNAVGARSHFEMALELSRQIGFPIQVAISHFGCAVGHILTGDYAKGKKHLRMARTTGTTFLPSGRFMLLTTQAYSSFCQNSIDEGIELLRKAFAVGQEHSILMTHSWFPTVMGYLCSKAFEHGIFPSYAEEIVKKHRLKPDLSIQHVEDWPWPIRIYTLGRFDIYVEGRRLEFSRKVQKRPLELLKVLVARGGTDVSETKIADILWPDSDGDSSHKSLEMTLSRLRRMIGRDSISYQAGHLSLNRSRCWVDLFALKSLQEQAMLLFQGSQFHSAWKLAQSAAHLYRGPFLHAEDEAHWATAARHDAAQLLVRLLLCAARECEAQGRWKEAADAYQKAVEVDPLHETQPAAGLISFRRP